MIASILELPFREGAALDVLGFADGRDAVDTEYAGFGWTRVDRLWLEDAAGGLIEVERPLVLALHAADDGPALADDVLLEFDLREAARSGAADELAVGNAVTARLSLFLQKWLPRLPAATEVVLALCNPHRARLAGPPGIRYALGNVDSWLDEHDGGDRLRLSADTWCTTSDSPPAAPAAPHREAP